MKKGLALEYIVRLMILLVVATVVLNIILIFTTDIEEAVSEKLLGKDGEIDTVEKNQTSFSTSQVKNYIRSCWLKTGSDHHKDEICYILRGDVSSVDKTELTTVNGPDKVDVSEFKNTKKITFIKFIDLGDIIRVEN